MVAHAFNLRKQRQADLNEAGPVDRARSRAAQRDHVLKPKNKQAPADLAQDGGFSSGVPKMLEAILFFLTGCSVGSSKPNEKLDPPPGGRKTLKTMVKC